MTPRKLVRFGEKHPGTSFLIAALALIFAISSLFWAYYWPPIQKAKVTEESSNRALAQARVNNEALCSFLRSVDVSLSHIATTKPSTSAGQTYKTSFGQVQIAARDAALSPACIAPPMGHP